MLFEGIFAPVTTPFDLDEQVYYRKIEANMVRYSRSSLAGVVVLGTNGEAVELYDAESREVLRVAAAATAPEKVLIAGVGRESVKATVELAEAAAKARYDAVLVRPPTYYAAQMTPAAVLHYFRTVADRSPLPVMLYNIPQCAPYDIPVEIIAELAQHPNIIGIKDSSGNMSKLRATIEATRSAPKHTVTVTAAFEAVTSRMLTAPAEPDGAFVSGGELTGRSAAVATSSVAPLKTYTKEAGFQVLTGYCAGLLQSLESGAVGAILGFACPAPEACHEVYLAWKNHDMKLAREKQEHIAATSKRIVGELGINGVKYACDFNGYYGGLARSPLIPLDAETKAEIERLLADIRN